MIERHRDGCAAFCKLESKVSLGFDPACADSENFGMPADVVPDYRSHANWVALARYAPEPTYLACFLVVRGAARRCLPVAEPSPFGVTLYRIPRGFASYSMIPSMSMETTDGAIEIWRIFSIGSSTGPGLDGSRKYALYTPRNVSMKAASPEVHESSGIVALLRGRGATSKAELGFHSFVAPTNWTGS